MAWGGIEPPTRGFSLRRWFAARSPTLAGGVSNSCALAAVPTCGLTYNAAARLLIAQGWPAEATARLEALIKAAPDADGAVIAKEIMAGLSAKP